MVYKIVFTTDLATCKTLKIIDPLGRPPAKSAEKLYGGSLNFSTAHLQNISLFLYQLSDLIAPESCRR